MKRKLIGNRAFYAMVLAVTIPIVIQNGITSFVNLLDNVMVGRIGTEQMSGVAIANQLIMIFDLGIFGGLSGAGIFTAQFFGKSDIEGVRNTFRIKLYIGAVVTAIAILAFLFFGRPLVYLFLQGNADVGDIDATAGYALSYLRIMLIGFVPFTLSQIYASTLKETGETLLPMKAAVTAVFTNLCLNYLLIFGKFGLPALEGDGAAIATVISRFAELAIIVLTTHRHSSGYGFAEQLFRTLRVPPQLLGNILKKGLPLLANELLWASGMAILNQSYSLRGLSVVAACNITSTVSNLFAVVLMAMGNAVAIIVGQQLGAGDMKKARDTDSKLIAFSVAIACLVGVLLALASPYIPLIYKTESEVRDLARRFLLVSAAVMPLSAFAMTSYFTLRSGGKTIITFLFDCAYTWVLTVPLAFSLAHFTALPIVTVYAIVQFSNIIKCLIGFILVKKGIWIQDIVSEHSAA